MGLFYNISCNCSQTSHIDLSPYLTSLFVKHDTKNSKFPELMVALHKSILNILLPAVNTKILKRTLTSVMQVCSWICIGFFHLYSRFSRPTVVVLSLQNFSRGHHNIFLFLNEVQMLMFSSFSDVKLIEVSILSLLPLDLATV